MNFTKRPLPTDSIVSREKPRGKFRWIGLGLIVLLLIWQISEYRYRKLIEIKNAGPEETELFEIAEGSTIGPISEKLKNQGFVPSSWAFEKYVTREGNAENFLAGRFYLAKNLTIPEVADQLLSDEKRELFLTIPEGLTLQEIDERISEKGYAEAGTFLDCIEHTCDFSEFDFLPADRMNWEGYFFPETYSIHPGKFSPEELGEKMLSEFENRASNLGILENENLHEIVIMASMVEEESRKDDERPIVAGILWKRLQEGWTLGVDATIRYFTAKKTETLTEEDLEADSPYNTRLHLGLPPTAISNPGESSLRAAANPESSLYYYYLHGEDGQIHYAVTNEEHNANRLKYL